MFLALIVAALAGLLGRGLLADARVASRDGALVVDYQRFARNDAPTLLVLHFPGGSAVWVDNAYLREVEIESLTPPPSASLLSTERLRWRFDALTGEPVSVQVRTRPAGPGLTHGRIGIEAGEAVEFRQVIYP